MIRLYLSPLIPFANPPRNCPEGATYYGSVIEEIYYSLPKDQKPKTGGWRNVSTTAKDVDGKLSLDIVLIELDVDDHSPFESDTRVILLAEKTAGKLTQQELNKIASELIKKNITVSPSADTIDSIMSEVGSKMEETRAKIKDVTKK